MLNNVCLSVLVHPIYNINIAVNTNEIILSNIKRKIFSCINNIINIGGKIDTNVTKRIFTKTFLIKPIIGRFIISFSNINLATKQICEIIIAIINVHSGDNPILSDR